MDGTPVGLVYPSVVCVMKDVLRVPEDEFTDCFDKVRILEAEAIIAMRESREQRRGKT